MTNFRKPTSRFMDAPNDVRCRWDITLPDGSKAQCGRRQKSGQLCTQHAKMHAGWNCTYCGGNDELPPDHCTDCTRPQPLTRCQAGRDGDCIAKQCPQLRDGEPRATGRHCPIDKE